MYSLYNYHLFFHPRLSIKVHPVLEVGQTAWPCGRYSLTLPSVCGCLPLWVTDYTHVFIPHTSVYVRVHVHTCTMTLGEWRALSLEHFFQ